MANLLNVVEVLTYQNNDQEYVYSPGQAFLQVGPGAQPFLGIVRDRPKQGQVWPRGEYTKDSTVGSNLPPPPPPPLPSDTALIYLSCDEDSVLSVHSTGQVDVTLSRLIGSTNTVAGESGLGRTVDAFNEVFMNPATLSEDLVVPFPLHRVYNAPFVSLAGDSAWTIATWFNFDEGHWRWQDGGDHVSFLLAASSGGNGSLLTPQPMLIPGWYGDTPGTDAELTLLYGDPAGIPTVLGTGYMAASVGSGWHHLAIVNDPDGNTLTFYIDGTSVYDDTAVDLSGVLGGEIGWNGVGNGPSFNDSWGSFDELYIYDRALSEDEVDALASV